MRRRSFLAAAIGAMFVRPTLPEPVPLPAEGWMTINDYLAASRATAAPLFRGEIGRYETVRFIESPAVAQPLGMLTANAIRPWLKRAMDRDNRIPAVQFKPFVAFVEPDYAADRMRELLGKPMHVGVDLGAPGRDNSVMVKQWLDEDGNFRVEEVKEWRNPPTAD